MREFDLVIIGGGPAGYNAAERAAHKKLKVALIEKNNVGGVCLNEGCVPTKALLYAAKQADHAKHAEVFGVTVKEVSFDHSVAVAHKDDTVTKLTGGVAMTLKKQGVEWIKQTGKVVEKTNDGFVVDVETESIKAKNVMLCNGSTVFIPPIKGSKQALESGFAITSKEALDIKQVPKKLVVVGGGVIGLELASYFKSAGSDVTVVELLDQVGGPIDAKLSKILQANLEKKGIKFMLKSSVDEVAKDGVVVKTSDTTETLTADKILLSVGRRADLSTIDADKLGLFTEKGAVVTDQYMRTNIGGLYAAGDINGKSMLAHTAYREGEVAVDHMTGGKSMMRYSAIPGVIYTDPEYAGVGETEQTAKQKGLEVKAVEMSLKFSGRYFAENPDGDGVIKLIADKKADRLLGVHMVGTYASEIIFGASLMIEQEMRISEIKETVFPHPTVAEIIREACFLI